MAKSGSKKIGRKQGLLRNWYVRTFLKKTLSWDFNILPCAPTPILQLPDEPLPPLMVHPISSENRRQVRMGNQEWDRQTSGVLSIVLTSGRLAAEEIVAIRRK